MGNKGKLIVATGFEKLPKVQKIAQSGHTAVKSAKDLASIGQWLWLSW